MTMTNTTTTARFAVQTHTASEANFGVNSYLVTGERDAFLVDAQFALAEAEAIGDMIGASGKNLRFVFITHGHPDHFLGLQAITTRFPDVKVLATAPVIEHIRAGGTASLELWQPTLGAGIADRVIVPDPVTTNALTSRASRFRSFHCRPEKLRPQLLY